MILIASLVRNISEIITAVDRVLQRAVELEILLTSTICVFWRRLPATGAVLVGTNLGRLICTEQSELKPGLIRTDRWTPDVRNSVKRQLDLI